MKVVLTGGHSFGCAVFDMLYEDGHDVLAVWTRDEKLSAHTPEHIPVFQQMSPLWLVTADTDVLINAHGTEFVKKELREACRYGAIGYHPSLLPRHRGRSAVEWTVAAGDPIAGGTVYQLDEGWDTGLIVKQEWCFVDPMWTASDLWRERLFPMGINMLRQTLREASLPVAWPATPGEEQDQRFATYETPYNAEGRAAYATRTR